MAAHCQTTCVRIWQRGRIFAEQGQAEDLPSAVGARVASGGLRHQGRGGYRLIVRRDGEMVRLFTRRGYDWTDRYPAVARAASPRRVRSFAIDDAAVCGPNGVAIFDALHRRVTITEVMLYAFTPGRDLVAHGNCRHVFRSAVWLQAAQ